MRQNAKVASVPECADSVYVPDDELRRKALPAMAKSTRIRAGRMLKLRGAASGWVIDTLSE